MEEWIGAAKYIRNVDGNTVAKRVHLNWSFVVTNPFSAYCTIIVLLILLPIIFIYTTIKELKDNIRLQLFMFYLTNLFANKFMGLAIFYKLYEQFKEKFQMDLLANLFGVSIILWLNVISYEIGYTSLKPPNSESTVKKDRKRFIWYIIYVNVMAAIVLNIQLLTMHTSWFNVTSIGITSLFLLINLATFLILSVHIFVTRFGVATITNEKNWIFGVVKIIARLFAMMGIVRFIIFTTVHVWHIDGEAIMPIVEILEVVMIFILFVLKENVWNLVKSKFKCCPSQQDQSITDEV